MKLETEILNCFRCRVDRALPLSADELLTASVWFIRALQDARNGHPLGDEDRFALSAMAWEIARLLNAKDAPKQPCLRVVR